MLERYNLTANNNLAPSRPASLSSWIFGILLTCSVLVLPAPSFAQGVAQGSPQAQVEAAARSRIPRSPASSLGSASEAGSTQPRVVFEDGQLSISATNSTLSDILYALRACTGADIDIPGGASFERVTAQLGPGPARKVLADLLTWSSFDYIIQGSDADPLSVQSVTLMVRVKSAPAAPSTAPSGPGVRTAPVMARPAAPDPAPVATPDPADSTDPSAANTAASPAANASSGSSNPPDSPAPSVAQAAAQASIPQTHPVDMGPTGSNGASKSPADMIQELQQMYQQRRMLQQQQNGAAASAPTAQ